MKTLADALTALDGLSGDLTRFLATGHATPPPPVVIPPPVVTPPGTFAPPDLLSVDFTNGTYGGLLNETPGHNAIMDDPTGAGHGKIYKVHYGPGGANADLNQYVSFNPTSGLGHGSTTWFRGDLYFPTGTVNFTDSNVLRKLTYWRTNVGGGNQMDFVIGMWGNQAFVGLDNGAPPIVGDLNRFAFSMGRWYTLELGVVMNSAPGVKDGSVSMFMDGLQVYSRAGLQMSRSVDPASTRWNWLTVGHQREGNGSESSISEDRYWDRVAFSTQRIGP